MTEEVNDLMEKIEKLEIGAKFEKWNEFPPEIKLECIERMDFKMRFGLRSTSHTERKLVDSLRYKFDSIYLAREYLILNKERKNSYQIWESYYVDMDSIYTMESAIPLLTYILNQCEIEKFDVTDSQLLPQFMGSMYWNNYCTLTGSLSHPIRIKHVSFGGITFEEPILFLEKCWTNIEVVVFGILLDMPINRVFNLPSIINARKIETCESTENQILLLLQIWSGLDLKIGTKLEQNMYGHNFEENMDEIVSNFDDKKISYKNWKFRMRTGNPQQHILIFIAKLSQLCCVVIPSKLNKSEYDKIIRSF